MKILKYIAAILLIAITMNLPGQQNFMPGFIVTKTNDTINGYIDFRSEQKNALICKFKEEYNDVPIEYFPGKIKAYRLDEGPYYISKKIKINNIEDTYFLEYLVKGIYSLYYLKNNGEKYYFIETSAGELIELSNAKGIIDNNSATQSGKTYAFESKRYIGILKNVFKESSQLYPEIDQLELSKESLISLTTKHHMNVCDDRECITYRKKVPEIVIKYGASLGMNVFNPYYYTSTYKVFSVEHTQSPNLSQHISPSFGGYVDCYLNGSNNFSFHISLVISRLNSSWEAYDVQTAGTFYDKIEVKGIIPEFNTSIKYTFTQKKISPYLFIGTSYWTANGTNFWTFTSNRDYINDEEHFEDIKVVGGFFNIGIGFYVRKDMVNKYFIELNQESGLSSFKFGMEF